MKSDSSDKSESEDSDDEVHNEPLISSTEEDQPPPYEHVEENIYLIDKKKRINKEVRKMTCECYPEPDNEDFVGCGEDCLNRLLMIECNNRCPCGDLCTNKRFQEGCKIKVEVFKTEKKGWGVRTLEDLEENQFVIEYCGEVMNYRDFQNRAERYDRQKRRHYYFMTLRADEIIDATFKGSLSRFINHSCEPNCVTQKWTVNGLLRIGFFTLCQISAGEELTFDYQLQRYGKIAQTCYCEAPNCRGIIGGEKHTPLKNTVERIVTPTTSSPRRRKKRNLASDFEDLTLEDELERLIGDHRGMTVGDQALRLSRLMVRAETMPQRIMLLKVLQNTTDQSCLKAFLRFQGLSLLWSWMVDAGAKLSSKLQLELLATLKYLPVTNRNQLMDSKIIKAVNRWAAKAATEAEVPSSCSSQESQDDNPDDIDCTLTQDYIDQCTPEAVKKKELKEDQCIERQLSSTSSCSKDHSDEDVLDAEVESLNAEPEEKVVGEKLKVAGNSVIKSPDELSEDDAKSTEDEQSLASEEDENVGILANDLLKQWSSLKEIYRIPKKTPVKKKPEVVVATSSTGTPATTPTVEKEIRRTIRSHRIVREQSNCQINRPVFMTSCGKKIKVKLQSTCVWQADSTLMSQPDSSGSVEEIANPKDVIATPPAPLMSVDLTPKSQGEPSSAETTQPDKSTLNTLQEDQEFAPQKFNDSFGWKSISSSVQAPSSTQEGVHSIPTIDSEIAEPRHQVFGYKQRMGSGFIEQGLGSGDNPQWMGRSKKQNKKSKWPFKSFQQFPPQQGSPQNIPSRVSNTGYNGGNMNMGMNMNMNTQQGQPWQGPPQQWQGGAPEQQQGPHFFGSSGPMPYQQGPFPTPPPTNVPPPNIPLPPNFPRNVPPPNYPPPSQQIPFGAPPSHSPYRRPPPNLLPPSNVPSNVPPISRYHNPPPGLPLQHNVPPPTHPPPTHPPPLGPYPSFNPSQPYQFKIAPKNQSPSLEHQEFDNSPGHFNLQPSLSQRARTPESTGPESYVSNVDGQVSSLGLSPSPVKLKPKSQTLPTNWKTATDPEGKVYYYHVLTRQTQWEPPSMEYYPSSPKIHKSNAFDHSDMDMATPSEKGEEEPPLKKKKPRTPTTPPGSPPRSPTLAYTTAAADTTENRLIVLTPPGQDSNEPISQKQRIKDTFRVKLSNVVVNSLNPYFKVDCTQGRITNVDDFKYLARKLTHGVMMKELQHVKAVDGLQCNDSVKVKTKDFIRNYMTKFDAVYKRT